MSDDKDQVQNYQKLVLEYEELGKRIQDLIRDNGGHTENMSDDDILLYRDLASRRDDLYNQIKTIEAEWLSDE